MERNNQREGFKSRLGFLFVSAGCAIGIGNVWRFPFVVGQNGGGLYVLLYLVFLFLMGVPVLTMELAVGRASRKSAVQAFQALEPAGTKWHLHGWVCLAGCCLLMMYYTTVSGWMLSYFFKFAGGSFTPGMDAAAVSGVFAALQADPVELTIWMGATILLAGVVCSKGLQRGIEGVSKYMMSALLALIVVLALHSMVLPGAGEGVRFYLVPSLARVQAAGLGSVVAAAMNQAFFTLSIGMSSMEIFGSYMTREHSLPGEAVKICLLDTFVALMSGLIIFPACFSYGVQPDAGPSLIFITLPNVFVNMEGGRLWGTLFFLFMTFASFSTVMAVLENIISYAEDMFALTRKKSTVITCVALFFASLPCILGLSVWSGFTLLGGRDVLNIEDFIVSNLILPAGSLVFLLFCVTKYGWGFDRYFKECNTGKGVKLARWLKPYFQFVLPVLIVIILVQGLR